jgi:hypothetical protein
MNLLLSFRNSSYIELPQLADLYTPFTTDGFLFGRIDAVRIQ